MKFRISLSDFLWLFYLFGSLIGIVKSFVSIQGESGIFTTSNISFYQHSGLSPCSGLPLCQIVVSTQNWRITHQCFCIFHTFCCCCKFDLFAMLFSNIYCWMYRNVIVLNTHIYLTSAILLILLTSLSKFSMQTVISPTYYANFVFSLFPMCQIHYSAFINKVLLILAILVYIFNYSNYFPRAADYSSCDGDHLTC